MNQVSDEKLVIAAEDGAVLSVEIASTGTVMIHLDAGGCDWSLSMYKKWKKIWAGVLDEFKRRGIDEVFSLIPKDDKIERFQDMFGLTPLLEFQDSTLYRRVL